MEYSRSHDGIESRPGNYVVNSALEFGHEIYSYWCPRLTQYLWAPSEKTELMVKLQEAKTYKEWHDVALRLDRVQGNDIWRLDPASPYYDYKLISSLMFRIEQLKSQGNPEELAEVIRSGLIRNMGSLTSSELYTRAYAGTKALIETYIITVCDSLEYISWHGGGISKLKASPLEIKEAKDQVKTYFRNARQSYGRTALILQGGSLFGLCHLGVIKSLLDQQLLPSVICGATVGSIVAAYVCTVPAHLIEQAIIDVPLKIMPFYHGKGPSQTPHNNYFTTSLSEEDGACAATGTPTDLDSEPSSHEYQPAGKQQQSASDNEQNGPLNGRAKSKEERIDDSYSSLFTKEVMMFLDFVLDHLRDITFEEAYLKYGRILNILVLAAGSTSGTFYNYLSTPKVVIRTAVLASIGSNTMPHYREFDVLVKNYMGEVEKHPDSPQQFWPANHKTYVPLRESPYTRLAELFNVNNYIVSITRPYFAPLLLSEFKYRGQPRLWHKLVSLVRMSAQYRVGQLADWGLISPKFKSVFIDEIIPGGFQVTVVPESDSFIRDLMLVFDSTNIWQKVKHWIELGERSVWPQMSIVWARTRIEYMLEEINEDLT